MYQIMPNGDPHMTSGDYAYAHAMDAQQAARGLAERVSDLEETVERMDRELTILKDAAHKHTEE